MTHRHLVALLLSVLVAASLARRGVAAAPEERLNIILFVADDLGWQHVSVPMHETRTPANDLYRTPNLERLAARGVVFTNAYAAAPVCTPTRVSILTGQSPARTHITSLVGDADRDWRAAAVRNQIAPKWEVNGLQPGMVTLPGVLSAAGYRTIHVGKTHLAARGTPGADPTRVGFDVAVGLNTTVMSYRGADRFGVSPEDAIDGDPLNRYHATDAYLTEALAIEAGKAIGGAVAGGQPFFLHFTPYAVHTPITLNAAYADRESYRDLAPGERAFATMVETLDAALGHLVEQLDALGVADRTVIIFTSDNGGLAQRNRRPGVDPPRHLSNAPLRDGKGTAFEGGLRVPTCIAWPGVTDGGGRSDTPVISYDLFPTVVGLAGLDIPAEHAASVDGLDLRPLLRGEAGVPSNRALYWNFPHPSYGGGAFTAMRAGRWKLIYLQASGVFLLFDLEKDLGETANLAGTSVPIVRDLGTRLGQWCRDVDAQTMIRRWTGKPAPYPDEAARNFGRARDAK